MSGRLPERFGPYVLLRTLGAGGMGQVFLAAYGPLDATQLCVVKRVLPQHRGRSDFLQRFRDEGELARRLFHDNLVATLAVGQVDAEPYIAQTFVEGHDLGEVLAKLDEKGERLPSSLAVHVAREVARALAHAHEFEGLNLVHRDVSPTNIRLTYEGAVKLLDFGLATSTLKIHLTEPGANWGKIMYMAPEQMADSAIDRRTDIYSLGVLLWELLTGDQTHGFDEGARGARDDLVAAIAGSTRRPLPAPSSRDSRIHPDLDAIVLRATAPEMANRHANASELGAQLAAFDPSNAGAALAALLARLFDRERERAARADLLANARPLLARPAIQIQPPAVPSLVNGRFIFGAAAENAGRPDLRFARDRITHRPLLVRTTDLPGDDALLEKLARTSERLRKLHPTHVAPVMELGMTPEGRLFFAMDHLSGWDISREIDDSRASPMSEERGLRLCLEVCRALESVASLIQRHGSIDQPGHIFVSNGGEADELKVILLGADILSRAAELEAWPEESDVIGVGRLLYALLGGVRHLPNAPPIGLRRPDISVETGTIVKRALDAAYPSVGELRREILYCLASLDPLAVASRADGGDAAPPGPQRHSGRRFATMAAIAGAAMLTGAVVGHLALRSRRGARSQGRDAPTAVQALSHNSVSSGALPREANRAVQASLAAPSSTSGEQGIDPDSSLPPRARAGGRLPVHKVELPDRFHVARFDDPAMDHVQRPAAEPHPMSGLERLDRARQAFHRDDLDEALQEARRAAAEGGGAEASVIMGNVLLRQREYLAAEVAYAEALRLDPSDPRTAQRLARVRVLLGAPTPGQGEAAVVESSTPSQPP